MRVFVTLQPAPDKPCGKTVYALLLPDGGKWGEVVVKASSMDGFGVFPRNTPLLKWSDLEVPVLMPYLGVECVTQDCHMLKLLLKVLRGEFEVLTVDELCAASSRTYIQDGLCAVAHDPTSPRLSGLPPLSSGTELLQVAHSESACKSQIRDVCGGGESVCYLLSADVRELLQLTGTRAHLWELLRAHSRHHHTDRHLATHVAHTWREEEGYVLINAHPAFEELLSITGMINEPPAKVSPNMKMKVGYARLLQPGDKLLQERGLKQPANAMRVWRASMLPPVRKGVKAGTATAAGRSEWDDAEDPYLSEKMVLYFTTRKSYSTTEELTVDYGCSYQRNYNSNLHRAVRRPFEVPPDTIDQRFIEAACWPSLPGWWNPYMQPERAAFKRAANGKVDCVDDNINVVIQRYKSLGIPLTPELHRVDQAKDNIFATGSKSMLNPYIYDVATSSPQSGVRASSLAVQFQARKNYTQLQSDKKRAAGAHASPVAGSLNSMVAVSAAIATPRGVAIGEIALDQTNKLPSTIIKKKRVSDSFLLSAAENCAKALRLE